MEKMNLQEGTITIRNYNPNDIDRVVELGDNPAVSRWLTSYFPSPYTRSDAEKWVGECVGNASCTAFVIAEHNRLVGGIGIDFMDDLLCKTGEIGYWLGQPYWGRGMVSIALKMFVPWCFTKYGLERIEAGCFEENIPSARVLEKAGFTYEGLLRNRVYKNGKCSNAKMFSILSNEV